MTNEEIAQRMVDALLKSTTCFGNEGGLIETEIRFVCQAARELVAQAYEEAAKATCHMCDTSEVPATYCTEKGHLYGSYLHDYGEDIGVERCHATPIRKLMYRLVSSVPNASAPLLPSRGGDLPTPSA